MPPVFVNSYSTPTPQNVDPFAILTSTEPYDINFAFPLHPVSLSSPRIRLTPFIPRLHARDFWNAISPSVESHFRYFAFVPRTLIEFLNILEEYRQDPGWCTFAVMDRTQSHIILPESEDRADEMHETLAGMIAIGYTSTKHLRAEIAFIMVLPAFQRTHVARTATALLLRYCLELPTASPPGLGLRRVSWVAHPKNVPSIRLAQRLGFMEEAQLKAWFMLPEEGAEDKGGYAVRRRDQQDHEEMVVGWGKDAVLLSLCWSNWEDGSREQVALILNS